MDFKIFLILSVLLVGSEGSKILIVFPTFSRSHVIPLQALTVALADKGHEVTFFSSFPINYKMDNYRDIEVPLSDFDRKLVKEIIQVGGTFTKKITMFPDLISVFARLMSETLQSKEMRKFMEEESFDLLIVGHVFTDAMIGLADHFKCPSILFSPFGAMVSLNQALGNPLGVSGAPHIFLPVEDMNFINRLKTFVATASEIGFMQLVKYKALEVYRYYYHFNNKYFR